MTEKLLTYIEKHGFEAWDNGAVISLIMPYADNGSCGYEIWAIEPTFQAVRIALGY